MKNTMNALKDTIRVISGIYKIYNFLKRICKGDKPPTSPFLQTYPPGHYCSPKIKHCFLSIETLFGGINRVE